MTDSLIDVSEKIDDPVIVDLLASVAAVAIELGIPFFAVGAMTRDLLLWYGFGIKPVLGTEDVDIAFRVSSWEEYDQLRSALEATGHFRPVGEKQRMHFKETLPIDVLPFGEIVDEEKKIKWRPDEDTELNLIGFEEAYENAITIRISSDPLIEIRTASAVGLVLLKLFAWNDRRPRDKDAIDLGVLIRNYLDLGNFDRLVAEHDDLLNDSFDYETAGARILGRDLGAICGPEIRGSVLEILDRELDSDGDLPLVVKSAASSPQIERTREFWQALREELKKF